MANRHLARSIALQTLFEWDLRGDQFVGVEPSIDRNIEEFAPGFSDRSFITSLVEGVLNKQSTLDEIITKAAPEWPIEQIANVDRNVLRLGLYELVFADREQVPAKVAINEAIELAKRFGSESSGRFVNGVLGTVYKELGEPGKDEVRKPKAKSKKDLTPAEIKALPVQQLVGAVVFTRTDEGIFLALVHDVFGYWTLTKGKLLEGVEVEQGARDKVKEEIGIDVELRATLGGNEYVASHPQDGQMVKKVTYFLAETPKKIELNLKESGGLDEAKWFPLAEVVDLDMYDDIRPLITKAVTMLAGGEV